MKKSLRLSFLYLLLIIPQYGNSPIPRMESWMEMDQGDGFVDRDLTSSLTGTESFGSAHKNYQNALIRKKESDGQDESSNERMGETFSTGIPDRIQREVFMPTDLDQNRVFGYSKYALDSGPRRGVYERPGSSANRYKGESLQMKVSSKNDKVTNAGSNPSYFSRTRGYTDISSEREMAMPRRGNRNSRGESAKMSIGPSSEIMSKGSACESRRSYDSDAVAMSWLNVQDGYGNPVENVEDNEYSEGNAEMLGHTKSELTEDELKEVRAGDSQGGERFSQDDRFSHYGEDQDVPSLEESDYFSEERSPMLLRGPAPDAFEFDYGQINPHGLMYKRDENTVQISSSKSADKGEEVSEGSIGGADKTKSVKSSRSEGDAGTVPKDSRELYKSDAKSLLQNNDMVWKLNSNLQSKELNDVMRDSQRALEEVQMFQQKLASKPQYNYVNYDWKTNSYIRGRKRYLHGEDKRNKREDEDEQKNMKTGTDEGGGEYEDEEGKGHNDEEEYYEEAELSGGKSTAEGGGRYENLNEKFYKRESALDAHRKASKEKYVSSEEDYELTLENAPIEHEDKSKKSSARQGTLEKNNFARKGVKIWDNWGKWSPCSVTCGVGRMTRWRHCIGGGCAQGEKEAQIKKCTNPAC